MSHGRHLAPKQGAGRLSWMSIGLLAGLILAMTVPAGAADGPNKAWLCHFEDHAPTAPYSDDRNGNEPGFWTVAQPDPDQYLTGDYIVRYNAESYTGIPAGLNPGQVSLCNGNGGEFILVSVNSLGSPDDVRGHRAQNLGKLDTYPDGWKG